MELSCVLAHMAGKFHGVFHLGFHAKNYGIFVWNPMASLWKISRMFFPPILDQDQMTPANGLLKVISPI